MDVENLIIKIYGFPSQHIWKNIQCEIINSCPDKTIKIFSKVEEGVETEVEFNVEFSVKTSIIESLK